MRCSDTCDKIGCGWRVIGVLVVVFLSVDNGANTPSALMTATVRVQDAQRRSAGPRQQVEFEI
jgi:hypothetical protein